VIDTRQTKSVKTSKAAEAVVRLPNRPLPLEAIKGLAGSFGTSATGGLTGLPILAKKTAMSKRKRTMTDVLKTAIERSGKTRYQIAQDTGILQTSLSRFMRGETSLRLDKADVLAEYLGLELKPRRRK